MPRDTPKRVELGQWIARLREQAGITTQQEAADRIGVSRVQVSRWESGYSVPAFDNCHAIADAYGVSREELLARAGYTSDRLPELSAWAQSLARRIERGAKELTPSRRQALERAVDSMLIASGAR